jgi:tetratricopeptide (TPR) repeat protein
LVRSDPEAALEFGVAELARPESHRIHWKIAMELADLAKRQNHVPRARRWYERAHELERGASQVWIEHAKMEEECGELLRCEELMTQGLAYCELNEALMIKALKHHERMGRPEKSRAILAKLRGVPLDKVWRTLLEGGLMEARLGNLATARRVFKFLMALVPWYGPVFFEAARVEERWGRFGPAMDLVQRGLQSVPRYGPLWFMSFRLSERLHPGLGLAEHSRSLMTRSRSFVSAELVWKMHFELAGLEERLGAFDRARDAFAQAVHACPANLRWKVWLSGARMELLSGEPGRVAVAKALLARAMDEVPSKMRSTVLLEQSRMAEFVGDHAAARRILAEAQSSARADWKVFLEAVLLELRANNIPEAISAAKAALDVHTGTGRLWAILIQLAQKQVHRPGHRLGHKDGSVKAQWALFRAAIKEVPKSGEVWCEGARLCLNPHAPRYFNLKAARRFLSFAIQFTPQYGDSFIEILRLKMIVEGGVGGEAGSAGVALAGDVAPLVAPLSGTSTAAAVHAATVLGEVVGAGGSFFAPASSSSPDPSSSFSDLQQQQQSLASLKTPAHLQRVQQLCVNAEPNYGSAWFACKHHAHWAPVEVLRVAAAEISAHLVANKREYSRAILAGWYRGADQAGPRPHELTFSSNNMTDMDVMPTIVDGSPEVPSRSRPMLSSSTAAGAAAAAEQLDMSDEKELPVSSLHTGAEDGEEDEPASLLGLGGLQSLQARLDEEAELVAAAGSGGVYSDAASEAHSPLHSARASANGGDGNSSSSSRTRSDSVESVLSSCSRMSLASCGDDTLADVAASSVSPKAMTNKLPAFPAPSTSALPPLSAALSTSMPTTMATVPSALDVLLPSHCRDVAGGATGAFSPATLRRAAALESGKAGLLSSTSTSPAHAHAHAKAVAAARHSGASSVVGGGSSSSRASSRASGRLSAGSTCSSTSSAALTSEDDEDDLQPILQPAAQFNSLHQLYPPIAGMTLQERHRALYGADPITP